MVCQLDIEAKRRKVADAEEAKRAMASAAMGKASRGEEDAESAAAEAARRAAREEKLRQREMLPMPACVTATSVYAEGQPEGDAAAAEGEAAGSSAAPGPSSTMVPPVAPPVVSDSMLAAAGSGATGFSYTSGIQDGTGVARVNRFTSDEMAASHRKLLPNDEWFNVRLPTEEAK